MGCGDSLLPESENCILCGLRMCKKCIEDDTLCTSLDIESEGLEDNNGRVVGCHQIVQNIFSDIRCESCTYVRDEWPDSYHDNRHTKRYRQSKGKYIFFKPDCLKCKG